jgi:DNA replication protein DnaC
MRKNDIDLNSIEEMSKALRMSIFKNYKDIVDKKLSFEDNLKLLLKAQYLESKDRGLSRRLQSSGLPIEKSLDSFQLSRDFFPHLDFNQVAEMTSCHYIDDKLDAVALGQPGRGKTHLACALGIEAVKKGYSVIFKKAYIMAEEMREAKKEKNLRSYIKRLSKVNLLIIDEIGFEKYDDESSKYLFKIISERYEKASTFYTSHQDFNEWDKFISDAQIAAATVDRIVHHSIILNMKGSISWRLENAYSKKNKNKKNEE